MNDRDFDDYRRMMADSVRMTRYRRAIEQVCPGRVVCEIGTGLGPLSLFALRAGARRVYGIEIRKDALTLAERVIRAHGFDESRFIALSGLSSDLTLPEPVDVLLSELLDSTGIGENTTLFLDDASRRLLRPGGVSLPASLICHAALAAPQAWANQERFFSEGLDELHDLSYQSLLPELRRHNRSLCVESAEVYSAWCPFQEVSFGAVSVRPVPEPIELVACRSGWVTGIAVAFDAALAGDIHLRTFPEDPATHWQQGFVPLRAPVEVSRGEWLRVTLQQQASALPSAPLRASVRRLSESTQPSMRPAFA